MRSPRCKWVRDRLPLLAGDDLVGPDRRRVESHLVGCPAEDPLRLRPHRVEVDHSLREVRAQRVRFPDDAVDAVDEVFDVLL